MQSEQLSRNILLPTCASSHGTTACGTLLGVARCSLEMHMLLVIVDNGGHWICCSMYARSSLIHTSRLVCDPAWPAKSRRPGPHRRARYRNHIQVDRKVALDQDNPCRFRRGLSFKMASGDHDSFSRVLADAKQTVLTASSSISVAATRVPDPAGKVLSACDELGLKAATGLIHTRSEVADVLYYRVQVCQLTVCASQLPFCFRDSLRSQEKLRPSFNPSCI